MRVNSLVDAVKDSEGKIKINWPYLAFSIVVLSSAIVLFVSERKYLVMISPFVAFIVTNFIGVIKVGTGELLQAKRRTRAVSGSRRQVVILMLAEFIVDNLLSGVTFAIIVTVVFWYAGKGSSRIASLLMGYFCCHGLYGVLKFPAAADHLDFKFALYSRAAYLIFAILVISGFSVGPTLWLTHLAAVAACVGHRCITDLGGDVDKYMEIIRDEEFAKRRELVRRQRGGFHRPMQQPFGHGRRGPKSRRRG